ncbi:hypothetical protein COLE_05469 [Cutaneotrichosporon oleaginosum]|nr:hypothetical protein COLE_05469 [Cutaneotrichosporon oleaginosum]
MALQLEQTMGFSTPSSFP